MSSKMAAPEPGDGTARKRNPATSFDIRHLRPFNPTCRFEKSGEVIERRLQFGEFVAEKPSKNPGFCQIRRHPEESACIGMIGARGSRNRRTPSLMDPPT